MEVFSEIFIKTFVPLFAIMDPFVSVPIFIALTRKMSPEKRAGVAKEAVMVAGIILFAFLLVGNQILQYLGISISALRVGGGIVLLLMGLQLVLGLKIGHEEKIGHSSAGLIIGTPLITGPGVITTTILLANQYGTNTVGFFAVVLAALSALILSWAIIKESNFVQRILGERGIEIFSRVMGLLLTATAVQFMARGGIFALAP
ncbi:MAG: MarC family protein [Candidatus Micrarchaeia archaeon]|jgi:multiple antibiotic resistance protein